MRASMAASAMWLTAAAEPATRAMPSSPNSTAGSGGSPGVARNIPTKAQSSISSTTRGFVISK